MKLVTKSIKYLKARMPVNIAFSINSPDKEILVPISKILFEWVIENLVKNAVDSMKGKGKIDIQINEQLEKVIINGEVVLKKSKPMLIFSNKQNNQKILATKT